MTNAEYLAELNRRLKAHPDYDPAMRFVTVPQGAPPETASGYGWLPPDRDEPMRTIAKALQADAAG
jgi:hypothetical protein